MALSPEPPYQAVLLYCDVATNGAVTYVGHTPNHTPWLGASVTELPEEVLTAFCEAQPPQSCNQIIGQALIDGRTLTNTYYGSDDPPGAAINGVDLAIPSGFAPYGWLVGRNETSALLKGEYGGSPFVAKYVSHHGVWSQASLTKVCDALPVFTGFGSNTHSVCDDACEVGVSYSSDYTWADRVSCTSGSCADYADVPAYIRSKICSDEPDGKFFTSFVKCAEGE